MMVTDGLCPSGYSSNVTETECREELPGMTISNQTMGDFRFSGCYGEWPPSQTCFSYGSDSTLHFVNTHCGQIANYGTHRVICKKLGNTFLTFTDYFNLLIRYSTRQ